MFLASQCGGVPARDPARASSPTTATSSPSRRTAPASSTAAGNAIEHDEIELDWDDEGAEKGGYETFMLKEIYEQPEAVAETIGDRVRHGRLELEGLGL